MIENKIQLRPGEELHDGNYFPNIPQIMCCGVCGAIGDEALVRKHFENCKSTFIPQFSLATEATCQHNWTTYDPTPGRINAVLYPHGAPIHQICVNCHLKRVGYPQPARWEYEENANVQK